MTTTHDTHHMSTTTTTTMTVCRQGKHALTATMRPGEQVCLHCGLVLFCPACLHQSNLLPFAAAEEAWCAEHQHCTQETISSDGFSPSLSLEPSEDEEQDPGRSPTSDDDREQGQEEDPPCDEETWLGDLPAYVQDGLITPALAERIAREQSGDTPRHEQEQEEEAQS